MSPRKKAASPREVAPPAKLLKAALAARHRAHAPYSKFLVGAAVMCRDGTIIAGCNVENASYGLTICAERTAIVSAVTAGHDRFTGLVVTSAGGVPPCGACLQVLVEFCRDLPIWLVDVEQDNSITATTLAALMPGPFRMRAE